MQNADPSPRLRKGSSTCLSSTWVSDTSITCRPGERNAISNSVTLSIDLQRLLWVNFNSSINDSILITNVAVESTVLSSGSNFVNVVLKCFSLFFNVP